MGIVKIRLNTWSSKKVSDLKFKRNLAPRESFVELCPKTKKLVLKNGDKKCKPWDVTVSRKKDQDYINRRKELYSGLCFKNKSDAELFMKKHATELEALAKTNPLFDHWSIMNVIDRFKSDKNLIYGEDITDNDDNY